MLPPAPTKLNLLACTVSIYLFISLSCSLVYFQHSSAPSALLPPGPVMSQPPGPPAHPPPLHTMPPTGGLPSQPPPPYYAHPPPHGYSAFGMPYFRPPMMMGTGAARHPQPPTIPPMSAYPQHTPRPPPPQAPTVTSSTQGLDKVAVSYCQAYQM